MLEQDQVQLGKIADVMKAPVLPDSATVSNEIAILLSTPVLQGAAQRLGMLDSEGRPVGPASGLVERRPRFAGIQAALRSVGVYTAAPSPVPLSPEAERQQGAARVTEAMRASLDVSRNLNALVIEVVASASDPVSAAAIANAVVDEYLSRQGRRKRQVADQALAWMNGEIGDLRRRIGELNRRAEAERRHLLGAGAADPATTENQLRTVGNALAQARTERADAEARLGELRLALDRLGTEAAGQLIETPEIVAARRQLSDLRQRLVAERSARGRRPIVGELEAQVASLDKAARGLVTQELERLDLDLRIKTERVEALQRESRDLQRDALSLEQTQVAIADIEREAAANQELYVVLLTRLNEIAAQKESIQPDARVLNAAVPPESPAGPRRGLLAAFAGLLGFVGFTATVLAVDALSGRFESLADLEEATGLTVLGAVRRGPGEGPSRRLVDREIGALPAEDGIELAMILRGDGALPRLVVLVPASEVGDADALALRIVASADRRDRSVEVITLEAEPGATGGAGLFRTMPLAAQMAAEQDGGARASAHIRESFGHCDVVLLILPPVAETALIVAWARQADSTIVVAGGARPMQAPVVRTVSRLREAGVVPAGVVAVAD
jgi:uncharacterized protein involved in exopolysaccharide biosynthesis